MKTVSTISTKFFFRFAIALLWLIVIVTSSRAQGNMYKMQMPAKYTRYFGYEVAMGVRHSGLSTDIAKLQSVSVQQAGANVGMVWANQVGKIRATGGLYYSDGTTPYTIDMAEAGVSGNLYLLRLFSNKQHLFEPYAVASASYQRTKFFGTYLLDEAITNYSMSKEPLLGQTGWMRAAAGVGVEVQVANSSQHFIHLFGEALAGTSMLEHSSNAKFANTTPTQPLRFTVGISFGLSRN